MDSYHVRWMIRRDMPEVLAIEANSFEFPWPVDDFIACLQRRNCIGRVIEHSDRVVGYVIYELSKTAIRVLNFAVAESHRRRGVGTQIIADLTGRLSRTRRTRIVAYVRDTNLLAQLFFQSVGFRAVSVLHGLYEETDDDAYRMVYRDPANCMAMARKG